MAQQHFKDECDINTIVRRFGLTGEMPTAVNTPMYVDLEHMPTDYQSALAFVQQAQAGFMELPAEVRSRFGNDPGAFLAFCENPANLDMAREMGLTEQPVRDSLGTPSGKPTNLESGDGKAIGNGDVAGS